LKEQKIVEVNSKNNIITTDISALQGGIYLVVIQINGKNFYDQSG